MSTKSVMITGAAGFLGTHLVDKFIANGYSVHAVDNGLTANPRNIEYLKSLPTVIYQPWDVERLGTYDASKAVEGILHLASPASPPDYLKYPMQTLRANIDGTRHLLDIAYRRGMKFLYASTSEIYGDPLVHPQPESYWGNVNPIGPRSVYDEAKRVGETYTALFHRQWNVDAKIIRIFNTYGPRMRADDGRVVSNFINQALRGEPLTIYGNGSQTRSFCYVSDLVHSIFGHYLHGDNAPINLGTDDEFTMLELATKIQALTNSTSEIIFKDLPVDDPKCRKPDLTKLKSTSYYRFPCSLDYGLVKTIDYFRNI